jgi:hypothetical protein
MTSDPNPGPGEFRCGDCITIRHHMEIVTLAVDSILDHIIGYANGCNEDNRRAISEAIAWVRRP